MHGLIAKTQETQTAQMTCYAGTAGGVIYDEGTVSSCETWRRSETCAILIGTSAALVSPAMQDVAGKPQMMLLHA